jgi:Mg2+ and Co2+ transporter CorA
VLRSLAGILTEPVMGFLALAALSAGLAPLLFPLPPRLELGIEIAEWAIIGIFALEYLVHLALAEDRRRFVLNPWRLVDAVIILAPLASLLPFVPDFVRSSPALRVLRLARIVLFGARARRALAADADMGIAETQPTGPLQVSALAPNGARQPVTYEELKRWLEQPDERWMHASNLDAARVKEIAALVDLPDVMVDAALHESSYPRLQSSKQWCAFALSLPGSDRTARAPVVILVAERHLLTLSMHAAEVQARPGYEELPWGTRGALHVIARVLERNETLAAGLEQELRALEALDAGQSPEHFFESIFRLKRMLTLAKGDLWRLRGLLELLASGRRELPGLRGDNACLRQLAEQADYLHETVDKAQEQVLTLLDLHLNIASYGVNRFMRLLAVVSSLALIPTIVGGLLGMNIAGNPWPVTLAQIAFGTFILMMCVLYAFLAKGWLR